MRSRVVRLPLWVWLIIMGSCLAVFFGVALVGWWSMRLTAPPAFSEANTPPIESRLDGSGYRFDDVDKSLTVPFSVPKGYRVIPYDQVLSCGQVVRYYVVAPDSGLLEPCTGSTVHNSGAGVSISQ